MDVSVLIIAFKRPGTVRRLINALQRVRPSRIFIACDGPRQGFSEEALDVEKVREILRNEINWNCERFFLFSSVNQGCGLGPVRAINWFFDNVEEGIILEDDCIPHPDFFEFCACLLERYRYDTRVWCISGNNYQNGVMRGSASYFFGTVPLTWGWATWKRAWKMFDFSLDRYPEFEKTKNPDVVFPIKKERIYCMKAWKQTYLKDSHISWWDYQWVFACVSNGGLTAFPNVNLVANIGVGESATHTKDFSPTVVHRGLDTIKHPVFILKDIDADRLTFLNHFNGGDPSRVRQFFMNILIRCKILIASPHHYVRKFSQLLSK